MKNALKGNILSVNPRIYFPRYVGQRELVNHLAVLIEAKKKSADVEIAPQFFGGLAGSGKTELATALASALKPLGFEYVEIPNSITLPQFLQLWGDCIQGKMVVIFIDEAHNFKNKKVVDAVKRLTETGGEVREVRIGESFLEANPFTQIWICASNMDATDGALFGPTGRFHNWVLQPLTQEETLELMYQMAADKHVTIHKDAGELLASRTMPNPRSIRMLVKDLATYFPDKKVNLEGAKALIQRTKRFPMGLQAQDVRVLLFVQNDSRGRQVGEIAAHCGGEDPKLMAGRVRELCGLGLMQTNTAGRKALSEKGVEYVQTLIKLQKQAKARKDAKGKEEKEEKPKGKTDKAAEETAPKVEKK
jgi:Holliday junction resolvasome RuvABC ATP-dependent DNA helicase subunit